MTLSLIDALIKTIEKSDLVELVSDLIRVPSVNPKDAADCDRWHIHPGEGALAQVLYDRLSASGLDVTLEEIAPGRPNLIARYGANKPGPRLAFNAHLDTIGAYEMGERAFRPEIMDGRLYGRGAADMKGALGCFVAALEALARLKVLLRGQVILTAVIGEEGPPSGTEHLVKSGFQADGAVVGEASGCHLFLGQRGGQFVRLRTHGKTGHGSMPESGVNAIGQMTCLLASMPLIELFRTSDPQYGAPTCTIGTIHGGARTNVIPDLCESTLDIRLPPGILPEEVLVAFQEHMAALGIRGEAEAEEVGFPAYLTQPEDPVARSAIAALDVLGLPTETGLAPYWSDLAYLKIAGVPAIVLGPGSILRAHSGDEYVEIDQLKQAAKIYALMAINYCGSPS